MVRNRSAVALILTCCTGCACNRMGSPAEAVSAPIAQEVQVREVLAGMWTVDNQVEREAIERSMNVKDERVAEALVAKLWERGCLWDRSY